MLHDPRFSKGICISVAARLLVVCLASCAVAVAFAQTGDFNGDSIFDCRDIDLLQEEIRNGSNKPLFDLNGDGDVTHPDVHVWLANAGDALGFGAPILQGDANLDGVMNEIDGNIIGINWRQEGTGWCQGDFSGDHLTSAGDFGVSEFNWYNRSGNAEFPSKSSNAVTLELPSSLDAWRRENGVAFVETDNFEIVSIPQRAPDGLLATVVAARAKEAHDRVVTFYDLAFTGDLHQVWYPIQDLRSTPNLGDFELHFLPFSFPDIWKQADSHVLIQVDVVGARLFGGLEAIEESNDLSNVVGLDEVLPAVGEFPVTARTGIGSLATNSTIDGFFLDALFQSPEVMVAHLTTPARTDTEVSVEVFLKLGVLGADENNEPWSYEGVVGFDEAIAIPFFAEPCDFNADGRCNIVDLDLLLGALGTSDAAFDLSLTDSTINLDDRDAWLEDAGQENLGVAYVLGDADLDGDVDASDLNRLGLHWQMDGRPGWQAGDFDGSGIVDGADLNALALNWLHSVPVATPVPEPSTLLLALIGMGRIGRRPRRLVLRDG